MHLFALATALVAATLSSGALADRQTRDVMVVYGDLDLADPEGIKTFDRRLRRAIAAVCDNGASYRDLVQMQVAERCRSEKRLAIAALRARIIATAQRAKTGVARVP
jgi:UrcA family protein